jgi:hypothetical protein
LHQHLKLTQKCSAFRIQKFQDLRSIWLRRDGLPERKNHKVFQRLCASPFFAIALNIPLSAGWSLIKLACIHIVSKQIHSLTGNRMLSVNEAQSSAE